MMLIMRRGWKHMAELDRSQTTIQYVACCLCWANKATDTQNQNNYCFSRATSLRERALILGYTHIACPVKI